MTKIKLKENIINTIITSNVFSNKDIKRIIENKSIIIDAYSYIDNLEINQLLPNNIIKKFSITNIAECPFETLSMGEKILVKILYYVNSEDSFIVLNNILLFIDSNKRDILLKYLKKSSKTIVNITTNPEECMYSDNLIIYHDNQFIYKELNELISLEKQFKEIDSELPFMVQLSLKLKYYNLVEKPILNMSRMVNKLWK